MFLIYFFFFVFLFSLFSFVTVSLSGKIALENQHFLHFTSCPSEIQEMDLLHYFHILDKILLSF